ncbi:MAG: hypothetical protein JW822_05260 [Spirochaetales bacterium]|nr:hypothetical protein [Spirochaetales bacterium]
MNVKCILCSVILVLFFASCADYTHPSELTEYLNRIEVGEPVKHENLTVVPLYAEVDQNNVDYITLQQALENKWIEISEKDEGQVPKVLIKNISGKRIYVMSGEVLTGCKQDRIIAGDMIIEPSTEETDVDVFCVEAGRWTGESENFTSKENLGTAKLRERAQRKDDIAQLEIWNEIAKLNRNNNVDTRTNAYQDIYEEEDIKQTLNGFETALGEKLDKQAVGIIVAVGGEIVSVDIFRDSKMLQDYWPKLLKSSALSALDHKTAGSLSWQEAEALLQTIRKKNYHKKQMRGEKNFRYTYLDAEFNISAHMYDGALIHLSGFPVDEDAGMRRDREELIVE